jgi:hypothetical protein
LSTYVVKSLTFDEPHNVLYAGTGGDGVWRCDNPAGEAPGWVDADGNLTSSAVDSMASDDAHGVVYAGTSNGGVWYASYPTIAFCAPWVGTRGKTMSVDVFGWDTNFSAWSSTASFGPGIKVNSLSVIDATHARADITVSSKAATGPRTVNVISGGEVPNPLVGGFSVNLPTPYLDSISPDSGPAGTLITLAGGDFGSSRGSSYVSFGGAKAYGYSWSGTRIKCRVPSGIAGRMPVTVTTGGGTSSARAFNVLTPVWYLAEGTTDWGFDTYISIENPNGIPVTALVTYMTTAGPRRKPDLVLPALSQTTINPREDLGAVDFSTKVECKEGLSIAVDRTMTWTGPGAASPEAHSSIGVTSAENTWYLPEGSSKWGFECWLLIQNPNDSPASCKLTYMIEGGTSRTFTKSIAPYSRASFNMAQDIGQNDASIKVEGSLPVIPERAMYRNNRREGHDSIGTTSPALDYYLAEGTTDWGFTTYVLVQNPNSASAKVTVTYMTPKGPRKQPAFTMPAGSRKTIRVNDVLPKTDASTHVQSNKPIIAERAMYWTTATGEACHDSIGMSSPHTTFYLPDGETSNGRETWTLVQNPNSSEVQVQIDYLAAQGAGNKSLTDRIPANSRKTYFMADAIASGRASTVVTCKTKGKKIMVERAMYWNSRGAGTDTIGGFSD